MKFVTYKNKSGEELVGVLSADGDRVFALRDLGCGARCMREFIAGYDQTLAASLGERIAGPGGVPLGEIDLQAPIPHPRHDLICVGQNYVEHALESARYAGREWVRPDYPIYFSKRVNRAVAPGGFIDAHADITAKLDYENELAVVMGKPCYHVQPENVFEYIFGYTIVNDVSAREIQSRHSQWIFGKGLDGFTPMGPWIVTLDEFATPPHLDVKTRVNGELRQNSNTNDFIFDIPRLVSELASGMTLEPGDIIITGTPSGVGMGFQPPRFLKAGDVVECEIAGIGVLKNTVK